MYLSAEGEKSTELNKLFTEQLPSLMDRVKKIQEEIKAKLEKSVNMACSQEFNLGKEYQDFARTTLEDIQRKIEADSHKDEESSFSLISWLGGSINKKYATDDPEKVSSANRVGKVLDYVRSKYEKIK